MAHIEALFVAAFDAKNADFAVLGHPEIRFAGEFEARHAGCIVMRVPQAPRVGEIEAANVEPTPVLSRATAPRVISTVPGTVQRPPVHKPETDVPQPLPRTRRR